MTTYTIKTPSGNVHIDRNYGIWTLPCLWVDDVNCHTGTIYVEIRDGQMYEAQYGELVRVTRGDQVLGWGNLDGTDQYHLYASVVPASVKGEVMRKLAEWTGLILPAEAVAV